MIKHTFQIKNKLVFLHKIVTCSMISLISSESVVFSRRTSDSCNVIVKF